MTDRHLAALSLLTHGTTGGLRGSSSYFDQQAATVRSDSSLQYQQQQHHLHQQMLQQRLFYEQQQQRSYHHHHQQHQQRFHGAYQTHPGYAHHYSSHASPYSPYSMRDSMSFNSYLSHQYDGAYHSRLLPHSHARFSPYQQQQPSLHGQQLVPSSVIHYPPRDHLYSQKQQQQQQKQLMQQHLLKLGMYDQQQQQQQAYLHNLNGAQNGYTSGAYNPYSISQHHYQQSQLSLLSSHQQHDQHQQEQQQQLQPINFSSPGAKEMISPRQQRTELPLEALGDISAANAAIQAAETNNDDRNGGYNDTNNNNNSYNNITSAALPLYQHQQELQHGQLQHLQLHQQNEQQQRHFTECLTTSPPLISASGTDSGISSSSSSSTRCSGARGDSTQSTPIYSGDGYPLSVGSSSGVSYHYTDGSRELEPENRDIKDEALPSAFSCVEEIKTESNENESADFQREMKQEPIDDGYYDNETKSSHEILNDILAERTFQSNNHETNTDTNDNNNNNISTKLTASPFDSVCPQTEGSSSAATSSTISASAITSTNSSPTAADRFSPVALSLTSPSSYKPQQLEAHSQQQQQIQQSYHPSNHISSWSPFPTSPNNCFNRYGSTCDTPSRESESPLAVPVPPHNSPVDYQPSEVPFMPFTVATEAVPKPTKNRNRNKDSGSTAQSRKMKTFNEIKEEPQEESDQQDFTPLPGFLQTFGSTGIGRFSETFLITPDTELEPSFVVYDENQHQNQQQPQYQHQQKPLQQHQQNNYHQTQLQQLQQHHQQPNQQHSDCYAATDSTSDHCGSSQNGWASYLDPYLDHANHRTNVRDCQMRYRAAQHNYPLGFGVQSPSPTPSPTSRYSARENMMMPRSNAHFSEIRCNGY